MYFIYTAFVNYLDSLDGLTDSLKSQILQNITTYEQTLPISLKSFVLDSDLLKAPKTLKDFVHQFQHKKEIYDLQERHTNTELELPKKNDFSNNYLVDIFLSITAIISIAVTTIVMYILCKHTKLKTLVTSLALQQIKEVGVAAKQEGITLAQNIECTCKVQ